MPVDLDTDLVNQVSSAVSKGEHPQRALVRLGVSGSDAARWLQQGEQRLGEGADPDVDDLARLWRAVDVAEADCELRWITAMEAAAQAGRGGRGADGRQSPVKAEDYLKMLQARFPDRWRVQTQSRAVKAESMEETLARIQRESGGS